MMITKRCLPRRTLLRGLGVTIGLPLLDGMVPALSAQTKTAARPVPRLGFFYVSNGMYGPTFHPKEDGKNYEMTPVLRSLEAFRDQMLVLTGLSNVEADTKDTGGGPHTRCHTAYLTGARAKRTESSDLRAGTSVDQYAASGLGKETALPSLELALEPMHVGNCDNGYSCTYVNTFSWKNASTPLPMENNPRIVFERLFGDGGSLTGRLAEMRKDGSILDWVTTSITRLQGRLGPGDRRVIEEYLESIRDVERRIQKVEQQSASSPEVAATQPQGIPESFDEHAKLIMDLQFLAYQTDTTRVVSVQITREQSARPYPWIGVPQGHHNVSHHSNEPAAVGAFTKINSYHVSLFARLVEKMRNTPDGDGTLLDHSMLLYGAGMGDGDLHSPHNLPIVIMGGGCGQLKTGRHMTYPLDTPMMNLGVSLLHKVGIDAGSIGDSTGPLADI